MFQSLNNVQTQFHPCHRNKSETQYITKLHIYYV